MTERAQRDAGDRARQSPVLLREVTELDIPVFFQQQLDPVAIHMAAFRAVDPADKDAFVARWTRTLGDNAIAD